MSLNFYNEQGHHALDANQHVQGINNTYVLNGLTPTLDSEAGEVSFSSGTYQVKNEQYGFDGGTQSLDAADTQPRKDVITVNTDGVLQYYKGEPSIPAPGDFTNVFDTFNPSPNDLEEVDDEVVLAEVWVEDGNIELNDRRQPGFPSVDTLGLRQSFNELYSRVAQHDFELSLERLGYKNGFLEVHADDSNILESVNIDLSNLGLLSDGQGFIRLENETGLTEVEFTGHPNFVFSVFVDTVNGEGYSGADDETVKKWDTDTMSETGEFTGHTERLLSVFVDTGNSVGYSGGRDDVVKKWDTGDMSETGEFTGHTDRVVSIFVDSENGEGYSGSFDDTVKKWDTDTMSETGEFTGHTGAVNSIFVDTDNGEGYSTATDGTVKKWDTASMDVISTTQFFTEGEANYKEINLGFTPSTLVLGQTIQNPENLDQDNKVEYVIEDENSNTVRVTQDDIDQEIDTTNLETETVFVTAEFFDDGTEKDTREAIRLDSFAIYFE